MENKKGTPEGVPVDFRLLQHKGDFRHDLQT